tara:strand:+ start:31 stop:1179 length:1149 start_codon:yes stop_codon:yes gene_type:complete
MTILAFILFGIILYTYFGYFALTIFLGLIINKKVKKDAITPKVALMIAAYNEENDIEEKILNSLAIDYPKELLDIIVVSDASNDKTDEIVNSYESQGIRLIRVEGRVGKTEARNIALKRVDATIILFSDATTEYEPNVVKKLVRNFADESVGMVTGHLIYKDPNNSQMGIGQKLYWRYESIIKKSQTKLGTLTGSIGCITAFRKVAYSDLPSNIIEDFTEPLMFITKGYRIVSEPEAKCYELTTNKSSQEWNMRVRVIRGGITGLLYAKSVLNPFKHFTASFQLVSHKVLRWLMPLVAICLYLVSFIGVVYEPSNSLILLFVLQTLYYISVLIAYSLESAGKHNKLFGIAYYLFIVNAASLIAIYKTFTEKLESTWETQREI